MATSTDGLKAPPRFATNEWAWAYTLDKLRAKDKLTPEGNPQNYAAASAIYKAVAAKYEVDELKAMTHLPDTLPQLSRAEVLAFDMPEWVVMRGFAWAANPDAHLRLAHQDGAWVAERYTADGVERGVIEQDTAEWLVRNSRTATQEWVADHASNADVIRTMVMTAGDENLEAIYTTVREALEGDENDAEHTALVDVADLLGIEHVVDHG